jgi:hypothetical protein
MSFAAAALSALSALFATLTPQTPQELFTRFLFCHDFSRGAYETQCVELNPDGTGAVRYKARDRVEVKTDVTLSAPALERFLSTLIRTRFLAGAATYESKKKVADLGLKRLIVDLPEGRREATFNYTDAKDVRDLVEFLDGLINQEMAMISLEASLKYQRLGIPGNLEFIEGEIQAKRIVDNERMAAAMERIQNDSKVLDSARATAWRLRSQLLRKK